MFFRLIRSSNHLSRISSRNFCQQSQDGWLDLLGEALHHNIPLSDFTLHDLDHLGQPLYQLNKDLRLAAYLRSLSISPVGGIWEKGGRLEDIHLYLNRDCAGPLRELNQKILLAYAVDAPVTRKGSPPVIDKLTRDAKMLSLACPQYAFVEMDAQAVKKVTAEELPKRTNIEDVILEYESLKHIREMFSLPADVRFKLKKLNLYQQGNFFGPHEDSSEFHHHVGTLLVALPSQHTGGDNAFVHSGRTSKISFSHESKDRIRYCAFFSDVTHETERIESGSRISLAFDVLINEEADYFSPVGGLAPYSTKQTTKDEAPRVLSPPRSERLIEIINQYCKLEQAELTEGKIALVLKHKYTLTDLKKGKLQGVDRLLYKFIKGHMYELPFLESLSIAPFLISLKPDGKAQGYDLDLNEQSASPSKKPVGVFYLTATIENASILHKTVTRTSGSSSSSFVLTNKGPKEETLIFTGAILLSTVSPHKSVKTLRDEAEHHRESLRQLENDISANPMI